MSENHSGDEELRRLAEQGMQGSWHLCPQCMSNQAWMISCEYKNMRTHLNKNEKGKTFASFIIASMCENCRYVELAPDMNDLGFDKIDWNLVADKKEVFRTRRI